MCPGVKPTNVEAETNKSPVFTPALLRNNECNDGVIDLFPNLSSFRRPFTSNFIFMQNNIHSYRHKHASICDILNKHLVDFLAISETKLDTSFPLDLYRVQNYEL